MCLLLVLCIRSGIYRKHRFNRALRISESIEHAKHEVVERLLVFYVVVHSTGPDVLVESAEGLGSNKLLGSNHAIDRLLKAFCGRAKLVDIGNGSVDLMRYIEGGKGAWSCKSSVLAVVLVAFGIRIFMFPESFVLLSKVTNVREKMEPEAARSVFRFKRSATLREHVLCSWHCDSKKNCKDAAHRLDPRWPNLPSLLINPNAKWVDGYRVSRDKTYRYAGPHQDNVRPTNWLSRHSKIPLICGQILAGVASSEEGF